jgi:RNA polymerase sigma factor (sigma-70 family)
MAAHANARDRSAENRRDAALVLRAVEWDEAAIAELYHKYHTQFYSWIRRWLRHKEWALDFADAAIAKLFENLHGYKPVMSAFSSWAFLVAKTSVIQHLHELGTERSDVPYDEMLADLLPALTGPGDDFVNRRLLEEVAKLEPEQRAAVVGFFFFGLSDEEIAEEQHIPRRRVCYRRHQGMAALKLGLSDIPFTSIRPETRFSRYYYMMTDVKENKPAQLGGEEGD